jgi:hypothetical protein
MSQPPSQHFTSQPPSGNALPRSRVSAMHRSPCMPDPRKHAAHAALAGQRVCASSGLPCDCGDESDGGIVSKSEHKEAAAGPLVPAKRVEPIFPPELRKRAPTYLCLPGGSQGVGWGGGEGLCCVADCVGGAWVVCYRVCSMQQSATAWLQRGLVSSPNHAKQAGRQANPPHPMQGPLPRGTAPSPSITSSSSRPATSARS